MNNILGGFIMLGKQYLENASKQVDAAVKSNDTKSLENVFNSILRDYEESCKRDAEYMRELQDKMMKPVTAF